MTVLEAYHEGLKDAILLLERGVSKGISIDEALDCLRSATLKTFPVEMQP